MSSNTLLSKLRNDATLRVVTFEALVAICDQVLPEWQADDIVDELVTGGVLRPVSDTVFLNMLQPHVTAGEAVPRLAHKARISLASRLSQDGILNNPSHIVTAVFPDDEGREVLRPASRRWPELAVEVSLYPMKRNAFASDVMDGRATTAERAIADWAWLAQPEVGLIGGMPPKDCDLSAIDRDLLLKEAAELNVKEIVVQWLEDCRQYRNDGDVDANMSRRLGF